MALTAGSVDETAGVMLLEDLKDILDKRCSDDIFTRDLVRQLGDMDHRPWPDMYGKSITASKVAALLRPFDERSKANRKSTTIKIGRRTAKGYKREWFAKAFESYIAQTLPP